MCARNWIAVGLFGELYSHLSIEPRLPFIFRLFSEEYIQEDFINRLFRICDSLSQLLVTLFCRIKVTFEYCEEATKFPKKRFETERPAFLVDVQSTMMHDKNDCKIYYLHYSTEFPVLYNDLLTSFQSRVALFPYNCKTFLRRTY